MNELLKFIELTQEFKAVRRKVVLAKEGREENDAEHSYQLAVVAWYLISTQGLKLDLELVLKYALVHDLVEVYAGDTPAIQKGYDEKQKTKHKREEDAAKKLTKEFPEFPEMHEFIGAYELKADEESRFVYALDKIIPIMNIYLDKGHSWKLHDISLQDLIDNKTDKVKASPEIKKYFEEIVELLKIEQATLFPIAKAQEKSL